MDALALTAYTAACINLAPGDHDTAVTVSAGYQITLPRWRPNDHVLSQTAGMTFVVDSANEVRFEDLTVGDILIQDSGGSVSNLQHLRGRSFVLGHEHRTRRGSYGGWSLLAGRLRRVQHGIVEQSQHVMRNGSSFQSDTLLYDLTASNSWSGTCRSRAGSRCSTSARSRAI